MLLKEEAMKFPCDECIVKVTCSGSTLQLCPLRVNYIIWSLRKRKIEIEKKGFHEALIEEVKEKFHK